MHTKHGDIASSPHISHTELAWVFLRAGILSFGGWSTTVILLEKELSKLTPTAPVVDLKAAAAYAQILPGATQVAIVSNAGYQLRGFRGALVATVSYLFPAISLMTGFGYLYFGYLHQANLLHHLDGLVAALSGIILANAYRIGSKHVTHPLMWLFVGISCMELLVFKIHAIVVLLAFGLVGLLLSLRRQKTS